MNIQNNIIKAPFNMVTELYCLNPNYYRHRNGRYIISKSYDNTMHVFVKSTMHEEPFYNEWCRNPDLISHRMEEIQTTIKNIKQAYKHMKMLGIKPSRPTQYYQVLNLEYEVLVTLKKLFNRARSLNLKTIELAQCRG